MLCTRDAGASIVVGPPVQLTAPSLRDNYRDRVEPTFWLSCQTHESYSAMQEAKKKGLKH